MKYFKSIFVVVLFVFGFLGAGTIHAAGQLSTNSAFPGSRIIAYYNPTSAECINYVTGDVKVSGATAEVVDWLPCTGAVEFVVPEYASDGDVYVELNNGRSYRIGTLEIADNPRITSVEPQYVTQGDMVTVRGENFGTEFYEETLYINDQRIRTVQNWSSTQITFQVPDVTNSGYITVYSYDPERGESDPANIPFGLQPTITNVDSAEWVPGMSVDIEGINFTEFLPPSASEGGTYGLNVLVGGQPIGDQYIDRWDWATIGITVPDFVSSGTMQLKFTDDQTGDEIMVDGPQVTVNHGSSDDELSAFQPHIEHIKAKRAWGVTTGSKDVVVAVVDSGINTNHIELTNNIWSNPDEKPGNNIDDDRNGYVDDTHGYDFYNDIAELTPYDDHGTMVAGLIGAMGGNQKGIAGIAWNVQLMPLATMGPKGGSREDVIEAIRYAVDNGADIVNLSLGGPGWTNDYTTEFNEVIEYAYENDVLIVSAVGNGDVFQESGRNLDINPNSPSCNDVGQNMVLGVGSVNANNKKSTFSDFGSCVDVVAPGEDVVSLSHKALSDIEGLEYNMGSGTSYAAPMVSGAAALVKSRYPSMSVGELRDRIIDTATGIDHLNPSYKGKLGGGLLDVYSAVSQPYTPSNDSGDEEGTQDQPSGGNLDSDTQNRLSGYILLQVEKHGEAWYLNPNNGLRYYMKDGGVAYKMMRSFGQGISNSDLEDIPKVEGTEEMQNASSVCSYNGLADRLAGRILLQVEERGEAWYVHPEKCRRIYMKDGGAAYEIMRFLGLGISNLDLNTLPVGTVK